MFASRSGWAWDSCLSPLLTDIQRHDARKQRKQYDVADEVGGTGKARRRGPRTKNSTIERLAWPYFVWRCAIDMEASSGPARCPIL